MEKLPPQGISGRSLRQAVYGVEAPDANILNFYNLHNYRLYHL